MEESIKENGKMVNNMVQENFFIQKKIHGKKAFGMKAKELGGLKKILMHLFQISNFYYLKIFT